jgi:histidyl-tRNA synthetase
VLPEGSPARLGLFGACAASLGAAGYGRIETPVFEDTELFARGVGESTDIVQKEMFTFEDMGGRSLTLRPEGTAPICRAYVEHGMHKRPQPVKLWYWGPFFRHEAPQAGRFRQFTQVGAEVLGSDDPAVDAEVIAVLADLLETAGARQLRLRLSSLGTAEARNAYSEELKSFLREHSDRLAPDVQARIDSNPLRAFDSSDPSTQDVMAEAPALLERLSRDDAEHFAEVRALLDDVGIAYEVDGTLVRGLDYYTRTVFEFTSDALGAQSGVGGGGRYDGLVEQLGGPPTAGIGWAAGIERILLAAGEHPASSGALYAFVVVPKEERRRAGFRLLRLLRQAGVSGDMGEPGRSMKGQLKQADRVGARWAVIVEDDGYEIKDMESGDQRSVEEEELLGLMGEGVGRW